MRGRAVPEASEPADFSSVADGVYVCYSSACHIPPNSKHVGGYLNYFNRTTHAEQ